MVYKTKSPVSSLCKLIQSLKIIGLISQMKEFSLWPAGFECLWRMPCIHMSESGIKKMVNHMRLGIKHIWDSNCMH